MFIEHKFQVGDIVRLNSYYARQRVTHIDGDRISTKYMNSANFHYGRPANHFTLVHPNPNRPKEDTMTKTLFKSSKTGKFGTFLTEDAEGLHVLQMADGGYDAFPKDDLEKVCPYTVLIGDTHYRIKKEAKLAVGDVVQIGDKIGTVRKLNTQCDNALKVDKIRRFVTEAV